MKEGVAADREAIGACLSKIRLGKDISKYKIAKETGLSMNIINSIERGSASYTIDSFLKYMQAIGVCLFFGDKSGKKNQNNPLK